MHFSQHFNAILVPIYSNPIMFAKDLSNKISPPRHQDTKLTYNKQLFFVPWRLCGYFIRLCRVGVKA